MIMLNGINTALWFLLGLNWLVATFRGEKQSRLNSTPLGGKGGGTEREKMMLGHDFLDVVLSLLSCRPTFEATRIPREIGKQENVLHFPFSVAHLLMAFFCFVLSPPFLLDSIALKTVDCLSYQIIFVIRHLSIGLPFRRSLFNVSHVETFSWVKANRDWFVACFLCIPQQLLIAFIFCLVYHVDWALLVVTV